MVNVKKNKNKPEYFLPKTGKKARMFALTTSIQNCTEGSRECMEVKKKKKKRQPGGKEKSIIFIYRQCTELLGLIKEFSHRIQNGYGTISMYLHGTIRK